MSCPRSNHPATGAALGRNRLLPRLDIALHRIELDPAEKFAEDCKLLRVPLNAVLEMLMEEWMSDHRVEIDQAHAELKMKGTEESFKRRYSPYDLEAASGFKPPRG